jgi:signal transduction histidine kinase
MTEHRHTDDALTEQAAQLRSANERLLQTNERLRRAADFQTDLMALVSHELSQPLSSIASFAELLATGWAQLEEQTRFDSVTKIDRNARRMVDIVRDMLLLFRLDRGSVSTRRSLVLIADVAETVLGGLPDDADVLLAVDPAACALVDRGQLTQVLANLVENSVDYGDPPIELSGRHQDGAVVITVVDRGTGIPEDIRRHLFDRAIRPGAAGDGAGRGRGLGLLIARHLLEANRGTIRYEPATPRGARFVVTLEPATQQAADSGRTGE